VNVALRASLVESAPTPASDQLSVALRPGKKLIGWDRVSVEVALAKVATKREEQCLGCL
jgi:hypothetical protein